MILNWEGDKKESETLDGAAMFIFIGAVPRTDFMTETIQCDHAGFSVGNEIHELRSDVGKELAWDLRRGLMGSDLGAHHNIEAATEQLIVDTVFVVGIILL